jgi:hypothetical protein
MVGAAGIEPATLCLEGRCSIRLSYAPAFSELQMDAISLPSGWSSLPDSAIMTGVTCVLLIPVTVALLACEGQRIISGFQAAVVLPSHRIGRAIGLRTLLSGISRDLEG